MSKKDRILPRLQANVLSMLIHNTAAPISTFELRRELRHYCSANPSASISKLRRKGALIEKTLGPAVDDAGVLHDRIVHYWLIGWL